MRLAACAVATELNLFNSVAVALLSPRWPVAGLLKGTGFECLPQFLLVKTLLPSVLANEAFS